MPIFIIYTPLPFFQWIVFVGKGRTGKAAGVRNCPLGLLFAADTVIS
jgi:hypothetical protein